MKTWLLTLILITASALPAMAQYPGGLGQPGFVPTPGLYQPNMYNRQVQPLSPYLNLLQGAGNPGVNYYSNVRPGLSSGQPLASPQFGSGGGQQSSLNTSQMRQGYLPQAGVPTTDSIPLPDAGQEVILSPSGHGVSYGNVFGISRTGVPGSGNSSRPGFFAPPTTGSIKNTKKK